MLGYLQAQWWPSLISIENKSRQFDNLVVTGGTVSCPIGNLQCHQWRQSCKVDDLSVFSVAYGTGTYKGCGFTAAQIFTVSKTYFSYGLIAYMHIKHLYYY